MCRLVGNHQHTRCLEKAFSNYGFRPVTASRFRVQLPKGQKICLPQNRQAYILERLMGVEPTCQAWEACILPMNYSRINGIQSALQGQSERCRYKNATANAEPAVRGFWEKSTCQKASAFFMVGVTGLEPMASWSRTKRDTKLRHTPKRTRFSTLWYYNIFHP